MKLSIAALAVAATAATVATIPDCSDEFNNKVLVVAANANATACANTALTSLAPAGQNASIALLFAGKIPSTVSSKVLATPKCQDWYNDLVRLFNSSEDCNFSELSTKEVANMTLAQFLQSRNDAVTTEPTTNSTSTTSSPPTTIVASTTTVASTTAAPKSNALTIGLSSVVAVATAIGAYLI